MTILDSGVMSHLIKDRGYFVDCVIEDRLSVKTANQGTTFTLGHGTCIVELRLGQETHCVVLKDCLHASSALLNLLSVRCMLSWGWGCDF